MLIKNEFPAIPIIEQIHITSMHSLFKIHYECGFEFPGETHDFWECLYILDGELCVSADERIYNMSQGELIFHKPLEFHKFIVNNPKGATVLTFSFSAGGPLTFWLRNKVFKLSQEQTQIIDSLLVYMQNKVDLINIETEKIEYYYLHPFSMLLELTEPLVLPRNPNNENQAELSYHIGLPLLRSLHLWKHHFHHRHRFPHLH